MGSVQEAARLISFRSAGAAAKRCAICGVSNEVRVVASDQAPVQVVQPLTRDREVGQRAHRDLIFAELVHEPELVGAALWVDDRDRYATSYWVVTKVDERPNPEVLPLISGQDLDAVRGIIDIDLNGCGVAGQTNPGKIQGYFRVWYERGQIRSDLEIKPTKWIRQARSYARVGQAAERRLNSDVESTGVGNLRAWGGVERPRAQTQQVPTWTHLGWNVEHRQVLADQTPVAPVGREVEATVDTSPRPGVRHDAGDVARSKVVPVGRDGGGLRTAGGWARQRRLA